MPRPGGPRRLSPRMRRLAWFAAYWLLGVVVLTAIALLIRLFLVPFTQGSS